jgi:hypothetical protein
MLRSGKTSKITLLSNIRALQLPLWGSVGNVGLYNLPESRGRQVHTLSARVCENQNFRLARNILFMKSVRCRYYVSIEDIVRYRRPFLLG